MTALANGVQSSVHELHVVKEIDIEAPIEIAFAAVLDEMGPGGEMPGGRPFPMTLEAWPGGRWYRDLGDHKGHLWGHVQVIKPPTLIEVCGPLFMSYAATSHVQYRLTAEGAATRLKLTHTAIGLILPEHSEGVSEGWQCGLNRIREIALELVAGQRK
jgi:hypothetical protein